MVTQLLGEVGKEVMAENGRDALKQDDVDVVTLEDAVDVAPVAVELVGKPADGAALRHGVEDFLDALSDSHGIRLYKNNADRAGKLFSFLAHSCGLAVS